MNITCLDSTITCPYCGKKNQLLYEINKFEMQEVVECSHCQALFVVKNTYPTFTSTALKVEGYPNKK